MRVSILSTLALLAAVGQITACQHTIKSAENDESTKPSQSVFQIAADTVPCTGLVQRRCLIVNNETFYEGIEGYTHQEGVGRIIKVERTQICNPEVFNSCPQDVGIYRYHLLEVIK